MWVIKVAKERVFITSNDKRNDIIERLTDTLKRSKEKHDIYKKARGEWQALQRKKGEIEQELISFKPK